MVNVVHEGIGIRVSAEIIGPFEKTFPGNTAGAGNRPGSVTPETGVAVGLRAKSRKIAEELGSTFIDPDIIHSQAVAETNQMLEFMSDSAEEGIGTV